MVPSADVSADHWVMTTLLVAVVLAYRYRHDTLQPNSQPRQLLGTKVEMMRHHATYSIRPMNARA